MRTKQENNAAAMALLRQILKEPKEGESEYCICHNCESEFDGFNCPTCTPVNMSVRSRNLRDGGSAY